MKKGWTTKPLGEFVDAVSTGPFGSMLHKADYVEEGIPLVNPVNMVNERIVVDHSMLVSETTRDRLSRYVLKDGDIVVARRGEIGRCAVVGPDEDGWLCGTGSFFIRPSNQTDSQFLAHLLRSPEYRERLEASSTGTTMQNLSNTTLSSLLVSLPPLAEQQRIVGLLDEAFAELATAQAHAEKNLQNARALFASHLQAVFTQRGKGWVEKTLEEVLTVQPQNGWSPPAANHADSGTPVLTLSSVTGFVFRPDKLKYTSANTDPKARYWIQNGDFLITRSNTPELVGHVAIAAGIERPTIYPDLIMRMRPDPAKALTEFLYYQMRTPALREEIAGRAQGANPTMKKISNGAVRTLPISVPPLDQQRAIVAQLDALSAETQRLSAIYTRKQAALAALKQSLLHQAFAGEL